MPDFQIHGHHSPFVAHGREGKTQFLPGLRFLGHNLVPLFKGAAPALHVAPEIVASTDQAFSRFTTTDPSSFGPPTSPLTSIHDEVVIHTFTYLLGGCDDR